MFHALRGANHLVFPNSRAEVESYTHLLNRLCQKARMPQTFWPHHGNLAKEIRHQTEAALKRQDVASTAVCTSTLEMGIDIGAVKSIAQIGVPPSVASLRQRLGRSGRREGEPAVLRGYLIESALNEKASLAARLRLNTVHSAATVSLLLEGWFEPPSVLGAHLSTLVQQLLSAIAQYGGLTAGQAYRLLCASSAPFAQVSSEDFAELLRTLGNKEILTQDQSGLLLHGPVGDAIVNHYSFYATFASDAEFRLVARGETLGTAPIDQLMHVSQRILFAGRTWRVDTIDEQTKTLHVTPAGAGAPPSFRSDGGRTHTQVRQRMLALYRSHDALPFLDATAQRFLDEGRKEFVALALADRVLLTQGSHTLMLTWLGDAANEAIACLATAAGLPATADRIGVEFEQGTLSSAQLTAALGDIAFRTLPDLDTLLADARNLCRQRWDHLLSPRLLRRSYASSHLDMNEAMTWLKGAFAPTRTTSPDDVASPHQ